MAPEDVKRYEGVCPFTPLGQFVYVRTYARLNADGTKREDWSDTCLRVINGLFSLDKRNILNPSDFGFVSRADLALDMYDKMFNLKWSPPGRGLWMMGTKHVERHGAMALNNCGLIRFTPDKLAEDAAWLMNALMLGVGVGVVLPDELVVVNENVGAAEIYDIEDSRDGWVNSVRYLLNSYLKTPRAPVVFNYSKIRPRGQRIKTFGGVAGGPESLMALHNDIRQLFVNRLNGRRSAKLTSLDLLDLANLIGKCVVSGNVRRSAEIVLAKPEMSEIFAAKSDPVALGHHRWVSNNSVIGTKETINFDDYIDTVMEHGEPGFVFIDNVRARGRFIDVPDHADEDAIGVNPCGEQTLHNKELCTLAEFFPTNCRDLDEAAVAALYATMYAWVVAQTSTGDRETDAVRERNKRLGVSVGGIIDAFGRYGRERFLDWLSDSYDWLREALSRSAEAIGTNPPIKFTTVKPSGTVSLLANVSPGIHYPHSEFYLRRVRVANNADAVGWCVTHGVPLEQDVNDPNTLIADFAVRAPNFTKSKSDATVMEQIDNAIDLQRHWSDNNVSVTVTIPPGATRDDVLDACNLAAIGLKAVAFMPLKTGYYQQLPYEEIRESEYVDINAAFKSDYAEPDGAEVLPQPEGENYCDGGFCSVYEPVREPKAFL